MKNLLLLVFILTPFLHSAQSGASMDKYIRIVGLAEKSFEYNALKIEFTLSEIAGNEYKKIRPKAIEDVKNSFLSALESKGISPSSIEEDKIKNLTKSNYGKVRTENYFIMVGSEEEAKVISKLELDGYKIVSVTYEFPSQGDSYYSEMSVQAIQDAKRKAENIAKAIGKEVGQILNIEDMKNSAKTSGSRYGNKTSTKVLSYRVNVTFELN